MKKGDSCRLFSAYAAKYCYFIAAFLLVLAPLLPNHYFPWLSFHSDFIATTALWVLLLGVFLSYDRFELPFAALVCLFVSFIPLIQIVSGLIYFSGDGIITSAYLFGFCAAIVVGRNLSIKGRTSFLLVLAACTLTVAVISVFLAIVQWLDLRQWSLWIVEIPPGTPSSANLAQPNNLATLFCFGMFSLIFIAEKYSFSKVTSLLIAVLLCFGLALTQSRTAWLIVGTFVIWWLWKRSLLGDLQRLTMPAVIGFVGLYILFINLLPVFSEVLYMAVEPQDRSAELGIRGVIWSQLIDSLWAKPFFGYGWNQVTVALVSMAADPVVSKSAYFEHSHNLFIDLLVWNGVLIGGGLIVCIIWWGVRSAISCRSLESWFALSCIGAITIHSLLEFPFAYAYFLFPIGLVIGSLPKLKSGKNLTIYCPRWFVFCCLFASSIFIINIYFEYRLIEDDSRLLRFETRGIGDIRAEQKAPDVVILSQLREFNRFSRTEVNDNLNSEEIKWMEKIAHRYPKPNSLLRYSLALFLNGRAEEGKIELFRLRKLYGEDAYQVAKNNLKLMSEKYPQLQALDLP